MKIERYRNAIEGKFGQAKRRFGLGRIVAKLSDTAESSIAITFLVMNLEQLLEQLFMLFFWFCQKSKTIKRILVGNFYDSSCLFEL